MSKLLKGRGILTLILPILFGASLFFTQTAVADDKTIAVTVPAGYGVGGGNTTSLTFSLGQVQNLVIVDPKTNAPMCVVRIKRGSEHKDDFCASVNRGSRCTVNVTEDNQHAKNKIEIFLDTRHYTSAGANELCP